MGKNKGIFTMTYTYKNVPSEILRNIINEEIDYIITKRYRLDYVDFISEFLIQDCKKYLQ
jgi:hypothetical protein